MNVVLVAEESAGLQMLRALADSNHHVVAVFATPPKPGAAAVSVWNVAKDKGFQTSPASLVKDPGLGEWLRAGNVDILLNVHSLHVLHPNVLAAPKLGAFNLHPGPLPRYAGLNAVSWALFRGETTHGVTVHRMERGIDTGAIAYQALFPIDPEETALSLSFKCLREGVSLMLRLLEVAAAEPAKIPHVPQDPGAREYFNRDIPEQGRVRWSWPARRVADFVRACDFFPFHSPWGYPRSRLNMQEIALVKAHRTGLPAGVVPGTVGKSSASGVNIACSDEWILVSKLLLEGKYVGAQEILRTGDWLAEI